MGTWYVLKNTMTVPGRGATGGGVPFITSQLVAYDMAFTGRGTVDLIYRPCDDNADPCASRLGTKLIQSATLLAECDLAH